MPAADQELTTCENLVDWLEELLPDPYAYPEVSGSTYGEDIRRLEWASRPLWAVFSLIAGAGPDGPDARTRQIAEPFVRCIDALVLQLRISRTARQPVRHSLVFLARS